MIKKFKNGKINLDLREDFKKGYYKKDVNSTADFYHHEMTMDDLYIEEINGYLYIVNFNSGLVYDMPGCTFNDFIQNLMDNEKIILYPYDKKSSKSLLQDLENGY